MSVVTNPSVTGIAGAAGQAPGTTTNDNATAGDVGEFITATVASGSPVALTTATPANVTSISLTAGDWDVSAVADFGLTGITGTEFRVGISAASATLPTQAGGSGIGTDPLAIVPLITTLVSDTFGIDIGPVRVSLATTTTIFLVAQETFSAGSSGVYGTLRARRAR